MATKQTGRVLYCSALHFCDCFILQFFLYFALSLSVYFDIFSFDLIPTICGQTIFVVVVVSPVVIVLLLILMCTQFTMQLKGGRRNGEEQNTTETAARNTCEKEKVSECVRVHLVLWVRFGVCIKISFILE